MKQKLRKQFRLYDLYRYATTGLESDVNGIDSYECNQDCTTIFIRFAGYLDRSTLYSITYFSQNEDELKEIIKDINKRLGNCHRPGPKIKERRI